MNSLRLGVVASMKRGLEQFIYREVCHFEDAGAQISLFPTKQGKGLYAPRETWNTVSWNPAKVLLRQPLVFLSMPIQYLKVLMTAIRYRSVIDFLLAAYFANEMRPLDAIYCTFGDRKLFVGYFAKLLLGKPLLCTVHAYELYQNPNPDLFQKALQACDQLITISNFNCQILKDKFGIPPERVEIVTYSINLNEYRPQKKFIILIVGFFVERKGHEVLFQAVKSLGKPDIEIWVVGGEGAESDSVDVRAMASHLELDSQVAFFGKQSGTALRAFYQACDLFCLPCHFDAVGVGEGFPNVIIEAMACGKPVISSKHVGIPEILEHTCVAEKDVAGLASAIDRLYRSETLRLHEGKRNRELAEQHFSPSNVQRTLDCAQRLCNPRQTRTDNPSVMPVGGAK